MKTLMEISRMESPGGRRPAGLERPGPPRAKSIPGGSALARTVLAGFAAMQLLCSGAIATQATNSIPAASLDTFKLIVQRNIFDANRRGNGVPRVRVERKEPKIDAFSLVGTLLHEEGIYAFFDGTGSDFRKVCQPGETIAGYRITEVAVNSVKLEGGEAPIELPIGMQMRREDEQKWQLILGSVASSASAAVSSSESRERGPELSRRDRGSDFGRGGSDSGRRDRGVDSSRRDRSADFGRRERGSIASETAQAAVDSKPAADSGSGASADEILKRLMQKREQELNK